MKIEAYHKSNKSNGMLLECRRLVRKYGYKLVELSLDILALFSFIPAFCVPFLLASLHRREDMKSMTKKDLVINYRAICVQAYLGK